MKTFLRKELTIFSWRAEEAAFAIVVSIVSSEDSDGYDRFLKNIQPKLVIKCNSTYIRPCRMIAELHMLILYFFIILGFNKV